MNANSQLHTVVDAVRALHMLKPKDFNKQWLVMGHSQGGAAAIAVSAYGQKDAPELDLKGAIALAPGGYQYEGIAEYVKTNRAQNQVWQHFSRLYCGSASSRAKYYS